MPSKVFSDARESASSDSFKGMASELLAVLPLVRQFAELFLTSFAQLAKELESFRALCAVMSKLQELKTFDCVTTEQATGLLELQVIHSTRFRAAYGESVARPKHHYALHLSKQIARDRFLLDTFVHERKHRLIKQEADIVDRLTHFERAVAAKVLHAYVIRLQNEPFLFQDSRLIGKQLVDLSIASALGVPGVTIAKKLMHQGCALAVGQLIKACDRAVVPALARQTHLL